jgi:fermentation-respiration switch protein FrsA (DUF1100 family)
MSKTSGEVAGHLYLKHGPLPMTNSGYRFSRRYWWRLVRFAAIVSSVAFTALLVYFIDLQVDAFVNPRRKPVTRTPAAVGLVYEDVTLHTADSLKISGWYIPGSRPDAIVVVHGISGNKADTLPEAVVLAEAAFHLLLIDLRGNGESEGSINTYGYYEALDVQAAVDYLSSLPNIEHLGALGNSLGGAVVARAAAADSRLSAVVITSSFSSLPKAVEDAFDQMSIFPSWPFAPLLVALAEQRVGLEISQVDTARDVVALQPRAVMIIHGREDDLFPVHHAQKIYEAAGEPKELWIIPGLGHANPAMDRRAAYKMRVVAFFDRAFRD